MTLWKWSQTAADNDDADSSINLRENAAPSTYNNAVRAIMAGMAKYRDDMSGNLVLGGTSTAYTITTNQGLTTLTDGFMFRARMNATSGAAPTLAVDGLTAKPIRGLLASAIPTGALVSGTIQSFTYDSSDDGWIVGERHADLVGNNLLAPTGTVMLFMQTNAPTGWTKGNTHNDKALRVVTGTPTPGGSAGFAATFASRTPAGTVGGTAITEAQLPAHRHFVANLDGLSSGAVEASTKLTRVGGGTDQQGYNLRGTATEATVGLSSPTGSNAAHDHAFTGTAMDFAVAYVDVILATKD